MNNQEIEYQIWFCKEQITEELNKSMAGIAIDVNKIHQYAKELAYWQAKLQIEALYEELYSEVLQDDPVRYGECEVEND